MPFEYLTNAHPIVQAVSGGGFYGLLIWGKARVDPDNPEPFCPVAFGTTILLSAFVGGVFDVFNIAVTFENVAFVLITYGGTIGSIEAAIKLFIRGDRYVAQRRLDTAADTLIQSTLGLGTSGEEIRESVDEGAADLADASDEELREQWDGPYYDEATFLQVEDSAEGDPTVDSTGGAVRSSGRVGEWDRVFSDDGDDATERERDNESNGGLPPA